jgi:hypothetical protein
MLDTDGRIKADAYRQQALAALLGSKPVTVPVAAPEGYDEARQTVDAAVETVWLAIATLIEKRQAWGDVWFNWQNRCIRHGNAVSSGYNKHVAPPTMDQAILGIGIAATDIDGYLRDVWKPAFPVVR